MGKASRARREKIRPILEARETEGLVKRARFYDHWRVWQKNSHNGVDAEGRELPFYYTGNLPIWDVDNIAQLVQGEYTANKPVDGWDEELEAETDGHYDRYESIISGIRDRQLCVTPPFELFWIEFDLWWEHWATKVNSQSVGMLIQSFEAEECDSYEPQSYYTETIIRCMVIYHRPEWKELIDSKTQRKYFETWGTIGDVYFELDQNGRLLLDDFATKYGSGVPKNMEYNYSTVKYLSAEIAIKSLVFANLKNGELIDQSPSPDDSAAYERKFGVPMTKYKVLRVNSMGKQYAREDKPQQQFDIMPLHIRRGNFAHYTDEAPLFGKFTGTFWRPATTVGNAKNGMVVKDYKVTP